MLHYIDDHLQETFSLHQLAQAAWYSPWHSARMFKEATGMPRLYLVRRRRLSEAAKELQDDDRSGPPVRPVN